MKANINNNIDSSIDQLCKLAKNGETVQINGKSYTYYNDIRNNEKLRLSFDKLANDTFGLSFESWYESGYWQDKYIPHALVDNDTVVANVSVNIIDTCYLGDDKRYIQLGTVMTDKKYRKHGLADYLMKQIINKWSDDCYDIYLYANDSVLNFYPQYGFKKYTEYQAELQIYGNTNALQKLDMDNIHDREKLIELYKSGNSFSKLPMINNEGLLMFYCTQFLCDNIYYIEEMDAVVIAEINDKVMLCYDIFGGHGHKFEDILQAVANKNVEKVVLGFTPSNDIELNINKIDEEDTTMFILGLKHNTFDEDKLMFPLLSRA